MLFFGISRNDPLPEYSTKLFPSVLKSDNANGLFAFSAGQFLSRTVEESVGNISLRVERMLGYSDQVTVEWEITDENGVRASEDFVQPYGSLVFHDGEREKVRRFR